MVAKNSASNPRQRLDSDEEEEEIIAVPEDIIRVDEQYGELSDKANRVRVRFNSIIGLDEGALRGKSKATGKG